MKKGFLRLLALGAVVCAAGITCVMQAPIEFVGEGEDSTTRRFFAYDYAEPDKQDWRGNYYSLNGSLKAVGKHCEVWVEEGLPVSVADAEEIAAEYDTAIYPAMLETFGFDVTLDDGERMNLLDVGDYYTNRDGKLLLLLLHIKSGGSGSGQYISGLFNGNDLLNNEFSNKTDMIYVDVRDMKSRRFYAAIAHEFQHLLHFVMDLKIRSPSGSLVTQETWVNEGLSLAAEYAYLKNHGYTGRVSQFNTSSRQENTFLVWDGEIEDYASAYLFFQWLRIQTGNTRIYRDILQSGQRGAAAVTAAAAKNGIPDSDWETLLRNWFAANYIKAPKGLYGYGGEIDVLVKAVSGSSGTVSLRPGEGLYSAQIPALFPRGSGHIGYAALDRENGEVLGPAYASWMWLLTFNANPDTSGDMEQGTVTAVRQRNASVVRLNDAASTAPAEGIPDPLPGSRRTEQLILPEGGYLPVNGVR